MARKERDDYRDILFGYFATPSWGRKGKSDGGFSVAVYADGRLIYKTYIFDRIERTKTEYRVSEHSVVQITALWKRFQPAIDEFDEHLDNGSCDGGGNFFIFNGKQIITWNIKYVDEDELKKNNSWYYEEYHSVVKQENRILLLFYAVVDILKNDGVTLDLNEVNFGEPLP